MEFITSSVQDFISCIFYELVENLGSPLTSPFSTCHEST